MTLAADRAAVKRLILDLVVADLEAYGATRPASAYLKEVMRRFPDIYKNPESGVRSVSRIITTNRSLIADRLRAAGRAEAEAIDMFERSHMVIPDRKLTDAPFPAVGVEPATPSDTTLSRLLKETPPTDDADTGVPLMRWLDHLETRTEMEHEEFPGQNSVTIYLETNEPVAVVFSADWHLGSVGMDYAAYKKDLEFLLTHADDLKIVTVGDLIDNFVRFRSAEAVLQQIIRPEVQARLLHKIAVELSRNKQLLAATWGNHDVSRDEQILGQSPIKQILATHTHFFDGQGIILLELGPSRTETVRYTILCNHTPKGRSMYDRNWGGKRMYRETFPADVLVTAHLHKPAYQVDSHYEAGRHLGLPFGGKRISIACGTYKTDDMYSRRYWTEGRIGAPTVLFWPHQRRMEIFASAENAILFKKGWRAAQPRRRKDDRRDGKRRGNSKGRRKR